ncbi:MAG: efflux RND transporter periplasmic adaptor subunit, partial [Gemmatimonadales bacterium]
MANMPGMAGTSGTRAPLAGDSSAVVIDRAAAGRIGITFARATTRAISGSVRLAGTLVYPEPSRRIVTARVSGWVERLNADYVGKPVRAGDALLVLYAPDLVSAQEEYLSARRLGDTALTNAARRRLLLWQLPADLLAALDSTGTPARTFVIRSPSAGEIVEKSVVEGQAVRPGDPLFLIADRATMWMDATVHEMDARAVRVGSPVTVSVNTAPGRT